MSPALFKEIKFKGAAGSRKGQLDVAGWLPTAGRRARRAEGTRFWPARLHLQQRGASVPRPPGSQRPPDDSPGRGPAPGTCSRGQWPQWPAQLAADTALQPCPARGPFTISAIPLQLLLLSRPQAPPAPREGPSAAKSSQAPGWPKAWLAPEGRSPEARPSAEA